MPKITDFFERSNPAQNQDDQPPVQTPPMAVDNVLAFVAPFFQHLGFDIEKAGNEFTAFQIILATFTEKRSIEENLQLIREKDWPNIEMIFMGSLSLPLDNAMSERGFSTINDIKTSKRNKLMDALFALMLLSIYEKGFRF